MKAVPELRTSFGPFHAVKDDILKHWGAARPFIMPAIAFSHGCFTEEETVRRLLNEEWFLILGQRSALIWEDPGFKAVKTIHFVLCGGDLKEIEEAASIICTLAKQNGFKRVYVSGRRGWRKILPGFKEHCTTYTMDL